MKAIPSLVAEMSGGELLADKVLILVELSLETMCTLSPLLIGSIFCN
jgi:hypothetical protein